MTGMSLGQHGPSTGMDYHSFLHRKAQLGEGHGFEPIWMPDFLFDFQADLVGWAIRQGRAAIFADCGLGKTPMQLVWAQNVHEHTGRPILLLTPLAVGFQAEAEACKFGVEAGISRDGSIAAPITITNYERLQHFDETKFAGVVCDESSAIKAFDGVTRALVTDFMRKLPYRLLCTATAAPNDYVELGTSSEALGHLGYMDMLSRFFTNKEQTSKGMRGYGGPSDWRFKGHAEEPFWRWVSSWARAMRRPSDLGFDDADFHLPDLRQREHIIAARQPREGALFDMPALGLREEREEQRRTIQERVEQAAEMLEKVDIAVAWCQLNAESELLTKYTAGVEVRGSDPPEAKEETLAAFSRGEIRVLVTKPIIGAWGLNWQHCNRMTYFPSHSYEQYYQAVRRCWRFGQKRPVTVDIVTTEGGMNALKNLERKAAQADRMFDALVAHMRDALNIRRTDDYTADVEVPAWLS
jgi:Helicase conserved C-terminal domain